MLHLCWEAALDQGSPVQSYEVEMCLAARLQGTTGLQTQVQSLTCSELESHLLVNCTLGLRP